MEKVKQVLSSINKIEKEDKTLSRLVPQLDVPYSQTEGSFLGALGYGRKKRATKKTGGAKKKKTGGAKKRAPRKRGMGAPVADDALFYSAIGRRDRVTVPIAVAAAPAPSRAPTPIRSGAVVTGSSTFALPRPRGRGKNGKGFGGFLQKLIQAPLAGLAATSGGLHGALGSFGKKKRGGRKMLGVMPLMNLM